MDKEATGLKGSNGKGAAGARALDDDEHGADADSLRRDIVSIRDHISGLVRELDRRRRDLMDLRLQLRRHPVWFGVGALALLSLVGGGIALGVARRRRRRLQVRVSRLRAALARMIHDPEATGIPAPHFGSRVLVAGGEATAATVAKQLVSRLLRS